MRKALMLCFAVVFIRASVFDGDDLVGAYRYTVKTFDSQEQCKDFLANPDERFIESTSNLDNVAAERGYTVKLECVEE